jgi:beta-ureidopropionase / N-carbamoyl-L-amino-acid hydrolase
MTAPTPDTHRLLADLAALARFVEPGTPGWTRRFPSEAYCAGRLWLRERMEAAGLATRIDAAGNLFGRREGAESGPPIVAGSHSDSVLGGGRYDGALGVLAALEAARCLAEAGLALRRPLVVADFLAEEANDFGVSCVGSRALAYGLEPAWLRRTVAGITLAEAITAMGGRPQASTTVLAQPGEFAACLELHIEQGPALEAQAAGLGAVTGIVGIRRGTFALRGRPDHAGTAPMVLRHDALAAAAICVTALETICRAEPGAVGTVGRLEVMPNQSNVVPGAVSFTAEIRSLAWPVVEQLWQAFLAACHAACAERGVKLELSARTDAAPSAPPAWLHDTLLGVCRDLDPRAIALPSGAGHDTGHLGHIAPAAMIFVPSIGGRSHCPEEDTAPEHLALGCIALARAIVAVDRQLAFEVQGEW